LLRDARRLTAARWTERVTTLLCALEIMRSGEPRLGAGRFSLGGWDGSRGHGDMPDSLARCPWCATPLGAASAIMACPSVACPFSAGLPVVPVHEAMGAGIPCVVVALAMDDGAWPLPAALGQPGLVLHAGAALARAHAAAGSGHAAAGPGPKIIVLGAGERRVRDAADAHYIEHEAAVFPPPG